MAISKDLLVLRQALPLDVKIQMTRRRIAEFVEMYGLDGVYVSFSGGLDSLVLLHISREMYPDIRAVYADTWMEMPQLREFVNRFDNVDMVKPYLSMKEVIQKCGWCFPSKEVADMIKNAREGKKWAIMKLAGKTADGVDSPFRQRYKKWKVLLDAPFMISQGCCQELKEKPLMDYEEKTGRHPIVALMAEESARRATAYLRTGCNVFDTRRVLCKQTGVYEEQIVDRPLSKPMGFWTRNDVLGYVYDRHLPYASPYGDICIEGQVPGQLFLFEPEESCACHGCRYYTTGEQRTGCMFCPIGCHLDGFSKFHRLKKYNAKLYDYCMEELGEKDVVEWVKKHII